MKEMFTAIGAKILPGDDFPQEYVNAYGITIRCLCPDQHRATMIITTDRIDEDWRSWIETAVKVSRIAIQNTPCTQASV